MTTNGSIKNPVLLYNLLRKDIREELEHQVILAENIYHKEALICKSGTFLDESTIYRLINFGLKTVKIFLPDAKTPKSSDETLCLMEFKKEYLNRQKCLVVDKDGYYIHQLLSILRGVYIKEENILAVNNSIPIKKIIEEKQPKYIFVDLNLYPDHGLKIIREVRKISHAHLFLTALVDQSKTSLLTKLKKELMHHEAQLLYKPLSSTDLRLKILDSVTNEDIKRYLTLKRLLAQKVKTA